MHAAMRWAYGTHLVYLWRQSFSFSTLVPSAGSTAPTAAAHAPLFPNVDPLLGRVGVCMGR